MDFVCQVTPPPLFLMDDTKLDGTWNIYTLRKEDPKNT